MDNLTSETSFTGITMAANLQAKYCCFIQYVMLYYNSFNIEVRGMKMARPKGVMNHRTLLREASKKSLLEIAKNALDGDQVAQRIMVELTGKAALEALVQR